MLLIKLDICATEKHDKVGCIAAFAQVTVTPMKICPDKLAALVKEMRGGESYRIFAKRVGVSHGSVASWENRRYLPDRDSLYNLATIKGWTFDELMTYLEGGEPTEKISMPALLAAIRELSKKEQATQVIREALAVIDKLPAEHEYSYSNISILERENSMCELIGLIQQGIQNQGLDGFCRATGMRPDRIESILNGELPTRSEYAYLARGLKVSREEIQAMVNASAHHKTESDPIDCKNNCTNGATNGASRH